MAQARLWVLLITAIFFVGFVPRIGFGPLMPRVEADLSIDHAQAGSLFLSLSFGVCAGLLAGGFVASRLTHRGTIILSTLGLGGVLLGISLSASLAGLYVGLACLGLCAGLYLPSGIASVTGMVRQADWQRALSLHELAPNLAFISSPLITEFLLRWLPWRGVLVVLGAVAFAGGLVFWRFGRGGEERGVPPSFRAVREALRDPRLWVLMVIFSLALGVVLGVYMMLPLYLVSEAGWQRVDANTLVAFSRVPGMLVLVFASGWLGDRLGPRGMMSLTLGVAGAITILLGLSSGLPLALFIILQPLLGVCFFPVGFAKLAQVNPLGVSFVIPAAYLIGGGVIPALMGWWAKAHSFGSAFVMVGALAVVVALAIISLGALTPKPRQG